MKKKLAFSVALVCILALSFVFVGCKTEDDDGGLTGGQLPPPSDGGDLGRSAWKLKQGSGNSYAYLAFGYLSNSNPSLGVIIQIFKADIVSYTATNGKLTASSVGVSFDYSLNSDKTKLTISNWTCTGSKKDLYAYYTWDGEWEPDPDWLN